MYTYKLFVTGYEVISHSLIKQSPIYSNLTGTNVPVVSQDKLNTTANFRQNSRDSGSHTTRLKCGLIRKHHVTIVDIAILTVSLGIVLNRYGLRGGSA